MIGDLDLPLPPPRLMIGDLDLDLLPPPTPPPLLIGGGGDLLPRGERDGLLPSGDRRIGEGDRDILLRLSGEGEGEYRPLLIGDLPPPPYLGDGDLLTPPYRGEGDLELSLLLGL
ncbi:hypothetical protein SAMD00019534_000180 [Acytostelium subglobosum LB1]|uniref:hypothetical protein n=1 Tax=Acytostelium subglobosum LB1 TaxID=1410327 RepID=UPI00064521F1|nr:hypothetical protein SAMD00019534_000180 [Acytostelium subglobosum LB1]GAM16843.1 hypothetical protein SAMD00019534_000180 [Acytostelium subglobosum LB1]|eukprot:XP_012758905.1 hypothetical protein SAMD00019534_000180 [Acytostelium subglobosum LB1]